MEIFRIIFKNRLHFANICFGGDFNGPYVNVIVLSTLVNYSPHNQVDIFSLAPLH